MTDCNRKKRLCSSHMLIIWSIIGLKWAAYVTIPVIIILFKWTNYMMAFPFFPFSEVLQKKMWKLFNLFLICWYCNVTLIDWQNNWSHFALNTWSLWYMSLLILRVLQQSIGLPVLPSCLPNNPFLIYSVPVQIYCICKQMSFKILLNHQLWCMNTFSAQHLKVESNQWWKALYLKYDTCWFSEKFHDIQALLLHRITRF